MIIHLRRLPLSAFRFSISLFSVAIGLNVSTVVRAETSTDGSAGGKRLPLLLVHEGKPLATLVLPANPDQALVTATDQFVKIVEKSTGAKLPVITEDSASSLSGDTVRVYIGPTREAEKMHLSINDLPEEGYRILRGENALYILGRDSEKASQMRLKPVSRPTLWALDSILEQQLGVRWLWPGELGTYVPKHRDLAVPITNVLYQPKLSVRSLWVILRYATNNNSNAEERKIEEEAFDWVENHQQGKRGSISFGHAFVDWWKKYGAEHPDYFAETLNGIKQPFPKAERVKLRLANPAVIEQIAKNYEAAGAPDYWNVCPNDGSGFDLSTETRAWDLPHNQSPEAIWNAKANLTARYVQFWNLLHDRLAKINPKVMLESYAYSAYRAAPLPERPLLHKMALGMVPVTFDYEQWKGWSANGSELYLRPNWWHHMVDAPCLPLQETAKFLRFAWQNGLNGIEMDSIMGYWAAQGMNYYLVARLMTRPDLSADDIIGEYASAFGAGGPKIREYLNYWNKITTDYGFMTLDGKFSKLNQEGKTDGSMRASRQALPYLYPDTVIEPASKLLDEAKRLIGSTDAEATRRVEFLQSGLEELRGFRDLMTLNKQLKDHHSSATTAAFERQAEEVESLRQQLSPSHAIWGEFVTRDEDSEGLFGNLRNKSSK